MKTRNQLLLNNGLILAVLIAVASAMYNGGGSLVETAT